MKKLVVCFDGTWNKPDDKSDGKDSNTNVRRIFDSIDGTEDAAYQGGDLVKETLKWYDTGVGTKWYEHIRGGAFGYGLSLNVRQGYKFLVDHYAPGDEIYLFGFSRGAYAARSLVGLIRNSGLLDRDRLLDPDDPRYAHWKKPSARSFQKLDPDDVPHIMDAYQLYRNRDESADTDFAVDFRNRYAHPGVKIKFLGVWDTVGALGLPFRVFENFNAKNYQFHDQELSGIVQNAFHAVAIDEHRKDYDVTLWAPKQKVNQTLEQSWFVGAHADVGGGYEYDATPLADAALAWMQEKAMASGLSIKAVEAVDPPRLARVGPTDSYRKFLGGVYRWFNDRHYRMMGATRFGEEKVSSICRSVEGYRPRNQGYLELLNKENEGSE